ncbi:MBL fold metallo-hydrolase RNA specificity domain-containing protein, partial [Cupriavidus metallidurans]|uniref:MBL fold metallo-hydrolase RNA specificity domain-containing protein n=1 Tax=Cupriavidus metallidurans TaxID=119219 RepID=UPI003D083473
RRKSAYRPRSCDAQSSRRTWPRPSAHADADEIIAWLRGFTQTPRRTFVTHGEPEAADALRSRIDHELGWAVSVPDYLQTVELA